MLVEIAPGIDYQAVTVDELPEAVGKLVDLGHSSAFHQERNDRRPIAEGRLNFDADRIRRIIDPPPPGQRSKPTFADDDKSNICLSKYTIDVFSEIDANRNVIDIPKYSLGAIMSNKTIKYPPGESRQNRLAYKKLLSASLNSL
jgi:hypothetical protein